MTPSFEEKFEQAVKDGVFPGAIMMAKDKSGTAFPHLECSVHMANQRRTIQENWTTQKSLETLASDPAQNLSK
jgi:hypothetical protein